MTLGPDIHVTFTAFPFSTPSYGGPTLCFLGLPFTLLTFLCALFPVPGSWIMYVLSPPMYRQIFGKSANLPIFRCVYSGCSCVPALGQ
jgi:hypothetical protein